MTSGFVAREFNPSRGLMCLAGLFCYGLGLSILYAGIGIGLPCPFHAFSGWDCPLCGATRMGSALLHLDPGAAFSFNPIVLVSLAVLAGLGVLWVIEVLGGPRVRPPEQLAVRLRRVHPSHWLVLTVTAAIVYTILRNLS